MLAEEKKRAAKAERKSVRRSSNWIAFGLLLYTIINLGVIFTEIIIRIFFMLLTARSEAEYNYMYRQYLQESSESGTSMIIGVILGTLFLWLWFIGKVKMKDIFQSRRKMTPKTFLQILCVFMGAQMVFSVGFELMEMGLNLLGYTAVASMENATSTSTTVSMFLYASLIAPIIEEIVDRGFVLRNMEKHGKLLAILVSSALFGISHMNLPQDLFAFATGLIFAYVAIEYSILWSIALHIINNCIFGDLLSMAIQNLNEQTQTIIMNGIMGAFFIAAVIILWKKRKVIGEYIRENSIPKKRYLYAFTAVGMIIFMILELLMAILMLEAI